MLVFDIKFRHFTHELNDAKENNMPNSMNIEGSNMPTLNLLATPYAWLSRLLAPCEDCWTWMTRDGSIYEEVDVTELEHGMVSFRHRHGEATVRISDLSPEIQKGLREANNLDLLEGIESGETSFLVHSLSQAG